MKHGGLKSAEKGSDKEMIMRLSTNNRAQPRKELVKKRPSVGNILMKKGKGQVCLNNPIFLNEIRVREVSKPT